MTLGAAPAMAASPATGAVIGLPDFADLVDRVGPAVVNIRTTERLKQNRNGAPGDEEMQAFLRRFFGGAIPNPGQPRRRQQVPDEPVERGVGSGFIT